MTDKLTTKNQTAPAIAKSTTWGMSSREFFAALTDQPVQLALLDGKAYNGLLVGVDQYDVILRQPGGLLMLIPKHAVRFVTPMKDKDKRVD